jgi:hypothetical protein
VIHILEWCGTIVVVVITAMIVWSLLYAVVQVTKKQRHRRDRAERLRNGRHP